MDPQRFIGILQGLAGNLAGSTWPEAGFKALEAAMASAIGHRLFTVMRLDRDGRRNRRLYSNDPAAYPVSGFKEINWEQPWARQLLGRGEPWFGGGPADIAWAYPDHEKILALGLDSAMNLPVRWGGRTLGTLNLLRGPDRFGKADAERGMLFAALAVPGFLSMDAE